MEGVFLKQKDNTKGHYIWGFEGYQALGIASYPKLGRCTSAERFALRSVQRAPSPHVMRVRSECRGLQTDFKLRCA